MTRRDERGFTLLEVAIATALTSALVLGACAAVERTIHANATLAERAALTDDALNVLSDLRVATAYDALALASIAGRTTSLTIVRDGRPLAVTIVVGGAGGASPAVATVTVADADGTTVSQSQQLYVEAPAPGSVVDEPSPGPSGVVP